MSGLRERYQDLEVWQLAYDLALRIYRATATFPSDERFGLAQQLRRASVSVFTNLAEGHARGGRREYLQFCTLARGSQAEVHSLLLLCRDLGLLPQEAWSELASGYVRVGQMLNRLVSILRRGV